MTHRALIRKPELAVFALVFLAYAYFYQGGGWNQNSRFDLVRALGDQRSAVIDDYHTNTGDKACRGARGRCERAEFERGDHYYSDKAPGLSWLALPAYAGARALAGSARRDAHFLARAAYASTLWAVALPSAFGVVALYWLLAAFALPPASRAALSLAYGLGTLALPYATLLHGHQLAAAFLLIGLASLVRGRHAENDAPSVPRLAASGISLGLAVVVEYPAALAVLPIFIYAASWLRSWRQLAWIAAGSALPALALLLYHWTVFGSPLSLPYEFSTQEDRSQGFFMGLGTPQSEVLLHLLFSPFRGLFYSSPWLLLALPGTACLLARREYRAEGLLCACIALLFLWLNSSLVDWWGGSTFGARYLIPSIPFFAIAVAGVVMPTAAGRQAGWGVWGLLAVTALYSAAHMLIATAVKPELHWRFGRPFSEMLYDRFAAGELALNTQGIDEFAPSDEGLRAAWNLGERMGLEGLLTLLPLALLLAGAGAWLWWTLREEARAEVSKVELLAQ